MTTPDLDQTLCPLCQSPNGCGMAAGSDSCWCSSVTISQEALARLPEATKGKACVCRRCGAPTSLAPVNPDA